MTRIVRMLIVATVGLAVSSATAEFIATFESPDYDGSAAGTVLTGQRGWYLPAGDDARAYTYVTNVLGITAANQTGGLQFGAGLRTTGTYVRAQHDYDFAGVDSTKVTRIAYDFNCNYVATNRPPTPARWNASISLQPSSASESTMSMREWTTDAVTPPTYRIFYAIYTDPGNPTTSSYTSPIFDNLPADHWFREEIVLDFATHRIVEVALTDLETSVRTVYTPPTDWYLRGGANSTEPRPTGLRFFTGAADNMIAYDNFTINADDVGNADGASDITVASATLNGYLQSTGIVTQATVYWGPTDGGTNMAAWSNSIAFGPQPAGFMSLSTNIAGLSPNTWYYYRFHAANGTSSAWAPDTAAFATREFANFYEDFDSYANGSQIADQGSWIWWADNPNDAGNGGAFVTDTPSLSGANSLEVGAVGGIGSGLGTDVVWLYGPVSSGTWTFRTMLYIPSTSTNGISHIGWMQDHPTAGGDFGFMHFDLAADTVQNASVPLVRDQWAEVRVVMRFDDVEFDSYYNGSPIIAGGAIRPQANGVDLWAPNSVAAGVAAVQYDDFSVERMYINNTGGATDLEATAATLNGELLSEKGPTAVTVYWGLTDGGTDPYAWENSTFLGIQSPGSVSTNVTGLIAGTAYYYRFFASSASWDEWAHQTATFETLSIPTAVNSAPSFLADGSARLRGKFDNQNRGDVTIYWGSTDGGTDPNAWDYVVPIGTQPNADFFAEVSGLLFPNSYYYTCYATNAYGEDWADSTLNFTTIGPVPANPSGSLNYGYYSGAANTEPRAIDDGLANGQNGGLFALTPTPEAQWPAQVQGKSVWTTEVWQGGNMADNYCQMWWGYFLPPVTGTYTFYVHGDDYEALWIDTNGDDEFQAATDLISDNTPPEGWNTPHTETVNLESGLPYAFALAMNEGGGGDFVNATITVPGGAAVRIIPGDPNQPDWWWDSRFVLFSSADVTNNLPADVTTSSATLRGTFSSTASIYDIWVHWGATDQTTNATLWANSAFLGTYTNASALDFSHTIAGIGPGATTYYAFHASNALHSAWGTPSASFATVDGPPIVNNIAATPEIGSATLSGELAAGNAADVTIYWGRSDGGTNKTAWDSAAILDDQLTGPFSTVVPAGYGATYYFRCYAKNVAGEDWALSTVSFTTLEPVAVGDELTADGQTFKAYFEDYDGESWLLIGRGREGWQFDTDGQGSMDAISQNVGTTAAFAPAAYSDAIINDLMSQAGLTLATLELRVMRAADPAGTTYQELRWRSFTGFPNGNADFTFDFDVATRFAAIERVNAPAGLTAFGASTGTVTDDIRDHGPNNANRVFTWPWANHGNLQGFSYGQTVNNGANAATSYLWESGNENHAMPYAEVYIPYAVPSVDALAITNATVSGVSAGAATLNGALSATGWVSDVSVYWGTTDGQTTEGDWDAGMFVGSFTNFTGALSYDISGLVADTGYYYTFRTTNAVEDLWAAPSAYFRTLGMPVVNNTPATDITQTSAMLNGDLVNGGVGQATIYWGLTDGGTTPGAWENATAAGTVYGPFGVTVPVLAGGRYYYRSYVVNSLGADWANLTETFMSEFAHVSLDLAVNMDPGMSPTNITGCVLWLAADDIDGDYDTGTSPADGDPINVWYDKSGLGHDAIRTGLVDPSYNTNGPNGQPVVTFGPDRDYMATTYNFDPHTEYTVLSVARYTGGDNERIISSLTHNWLFGFHGNGINEFHAEGWIHNGLGVDTSWHIHAGHVNSDGDPKASFWTDGLLQIADGTGSGSGNHMIGRLGLGGYRDNSEESNCEIAEVLIFDRVLTDKELQQIGFYLDRKYGLNTAYSPVSEARGSFTATATLTAPAASNVTVNFAFGGGIPPGPLAHMGYHKAAWLETEIQANMDLNNNGGLMALAPYGTTTLAMGPAGRGLDFNDDNDFINSGAIGQVDNYLNLFLGYFVPRETGTYLLRRGADDDRMGIWLDLDRDGVFESTTPGVGSDRGEQLQWDNDAGVKSVTLTEGLAYMFAVTHAEAGGGSQIDVRITQPGGVEQIVKPVDPLQYGMWTDAATMTHTASYPTEYTCPASVVIPAGSLSATVTVTPVGDTDPEEDEAASLSVDSVVNGVVGSPSQVSFVISSDDPEVINGAASDITPGMATVSGTLTKGDYASVRVYYGTTDGGTDASAWEGTNVLDYVVEDVPFFVTLSGLAGGQTYYYRCYAVNENTLGEDWADATDSFTTDRSLLSVDDIAVVEGDSGSVAAVFTISLSAPTIGNVTLNYATLDGTARVTDGDYAAVNGSLSIPVGQTSTQVTVLVHGDTAGEGVSETFEMRLSNLFGAIMADDRATCTIEDDDVQAYLASWTYRMPITFSGYAGGETLMAWPALVRFSEDIPGFSYDQFASATGGDLRFTNADGTRLIPFEIESWDPAGESAVWVQVPKLVGTDTQIRAYWGSSGGDSLPAYATDGSMWNAAYLGVWHLHDTVGVDIYPDSTAGGYHGINTGSINAQGNIGDAQDFNAAGSITLPPAAFASIGDEITLSLWQFGDAATQPRSDTIFSGYSGNTRQLSSHLPWGNNNVYWDAFGNYDRINKAATPAEFEGGWNYWTYTKNRAAGTMRIYANGALWHSGTGMTRAYVPVDAVRLGSAYNGTESYDGIVDEFRCSDVERSADWIKASYDNQVKPSTFTTYSLVMSKPGTVLIVR